MALKKDVLAICFLVILPFLFFYRLFFPLSFFTTPDIGRSDSWHLSIANKFYYWEHLQKNTIPIWNPDIGTGYPALAEGQTGMFFLPNLIFFKIPNFALAYNLVLVFSFITAATGTYLFCRLQKLTRLSAIFAAIVFSLGGFFIVHVQHLNLIQTASMLPWLFYLALKFIKTRKLLFLQLLSTFISQQMFAGHPQTTFYSVCGLFIYVSVLTIGNRKKLIKTILLLVLSVGFGLALSAIQILPTVELLNTIEKEAASRLNIDEFIYKPVNLLQFLDPYILGNPTLNTYPVWQKGVWGIYWESIAYSGVIPLILALAVILAFPFKKTISKKPIAAFTAILFISIALALGKYSPTHPIFSIPPFSFFRVPSRFLLLSQFSIALLGAFYLSSARLKSKLTIVVMLITVFDLCFYFLNYNPTGSAKSWLAEPATANLIKNTNGQRIFSFGQFGAWNLNNNLKDWNKNDYFYFARNGLDRNSNLLFKVPNFYVQEALEPFRNFVLRSVLEVSLQKKQGYYEVSSGSASFLAASNISHLLTTDPINSKDFEKVFEAKDNGSLFYVYKNKVAPTRFFLTTNWKQAATIREIVIAYTKSHNPQDIAVLEKKIKLPKNTLTQKNIKITKDAEAQTIIETETDQQALLVSSASFYPGWEAKIDGIQTPILAANINQRAVLIPAGHHVLEFIYKPKSLKIGMIISAISILLLLMLFKYRAKGIKI